MKRAIVMFMMVALLLGACAPKASAPMPYEMNDSMSQEAGVMPEAAPMEARSAAVSNTFDSSLNDVERLVIRNANLSIVVKSPAESLDAIMRMATDMGGFVVDSSLYQRQTPTGVQVQEARVTVRVPADRLDQAMDQIKALVDNPATDVLNENVTGQDVTKEYTDLQSRLRNLEDAADKLREIMDSATRPEDVLAVFNELKNVNEQIEILKGQIKYYEESAAMSAISVFIQAQETIAPLSVAGWKPQGVAREALQALIYAYQWIANAVIWLALFCLPIALPIGLVLFFVVRAVIRWRRKRKATTVGTKAEASQESKPD